MSIRLVLADDHPIVLEGLCRLFEHEPDMTVVARCGDGETALVAVREHRPDLLLTDLRMPRLSGMDLLRRSASEGLDVPVVLIAGDIEEDDLLEAVQLGVRGVVLKEMAPDLLVRCVRTVHGGGQWLDGQLTGRALTRLLARESARQRLTKLLTPREIELTKHVTEGLRNKEIAARLGITEGTVKIHLHRIYDKLAVSSRVELVNYVRREG